MIKRAFWFGAGLGVGLGGSYWMSRAVRRTAERYTPQRIGTDLAVSARDLALDVVDAVREGREAMRQREEELRAGTGPGATVIRRHEAIEPTVVLPPQAAYATVPAVPASTTQSRRDARRRARRTRR